MGLHRVEHVMGTAISIDLVDTADDRLLDGLVGWFRHVDEVFSPFRPDSLVSRIGRGELAPDHPSLGGDVGDVLCRCASLARRTEGVFDVWNLPSPNGTRFDPCGFVKGWSVQRAADRLRAAGVHHFCLNAGGDLVLGGRNRDGGPWRVGVRHPHDPRAVALVLEAEGPLAVATSGSYERGAHVVDPRSGDRVAPVASVTVLGSDLGEVDAWATTVYALGLPGLELLERAGPAAACVITHDLEIVTTPRFSDHVVAPVARH